MINKATLVGRIGKKELKTLKNGTNMCFYSVATSRKYIDSQGVTQEKTTWHNVNAFNKLADIANKYGHVGNLVYIEGEIENRKIEDANGTRHISSITANEIKFLPSTKTEPKPEKETKPDLFGDSDSDQIPF